MLWYDITTAYEEVDDVFSKFPNNLFYNEQELYSEIGGLKGFALYFAILRLKNGYDYIYTTKNVILGIANIDSNTTRGRKQLDSTLSVLRQRNLLNFDDDVMNAKGNDLIKIQWINPVDTGWIKLYYSELIALDELDILESAILVLMKSYTNHKTKTSYLLVSEMSTMLGARKDSVVNAIESLEKFGLVDIVRGHTDSENGKYTRTRSQYRVIG